MIRVSLDVSFAAGQPGQPPHVTGIGRVITEVARRVDRYADLEVNCVGCFGGDWNAIVTDEMSSRWVNKELSGSPPFRRCHVSRTGLTHKISSQLIDWSVQRTFNGVSGIRYRITRLWQHLVRSLLAADLRPSIDLQNTDVFVATFRPPPEWLGVDLPRVVFIYDVYPLHFPKEAGADVCGMLDQVLRSLVYNRDVVVVNSWYTRADFCQRTGFPSDRVYVAYLAADERFRPVSDQQAVNHVRQRYHIGEQPYVLLVANPQPRKDLSTAVRAFAVAARAMPNWDGRLILAGNSKAGWGYESLHSTIAEYPDIGNRIQSIGPVVEEDLPTVYSGAFAFLFPSRFEGFGLPVLEAMSCGVPVICSNATSLPEVGGNAPLYCSPGDIDAFSHAFATLVSDGALRNRMRDEGLRQASKFAWSKTASDIRAAIYQAAGSPVDTID